MYILLRGKVTIYILYATKAEGDDDKPNQPVLTAKGGESLRQQLGTFVVTLGKKRRCVGLPVNTPLLGL